MDIEDGEPAALAGFNIQRWKPRLVCIEMHPSVAAAINEYFNQNDYVRLKSFTYVDGLNGYYVPAGSPSLRDEERRMKEWNCNLRRLLGLFSWRP